MPITADVFCSHLKRHGVTFIAAVPCSYFKDVIDIVDGDPSLTYVRSVNEGAALATAAGASAAGAQAAVFLQNSGFGNLVNPLTSLSLIYNLPTLIFMSLRAFPDSRHDEPQHRIMGETTEQLLDLFSVPHWIMPTDPMQFAAVLDQAMTLQRQNKPAAILIPKGAIAAAPNRPAQTVTDHSRPLSRLDAISAVAAALSNQDAIVSTTGMISRELYLACDRPGNFYMQGSMGHAMAIGLGAALAKPKQRVCILDGDGAVLMHMGTLSTIGAHAPSNLCHVILDNEAYSSTGNQKTSSATTALEAVARACGYRYTQRCTTPEEITSALQQAAAADGPSCILIKINLQEQPSLPRITEKYTPADTYEQFRSFLDLPLALATSPEIASLETAE